jgi:hypothetical protein
MILRAQFRDSKGRVDSSARRDGSFLVGSLGSSDAFGERRALCVEGRTLTHNRLREQASRIAASLQAYSEYSKTPLTAVFGHQFRLHFLSGLQEGGLPGGSSVLKVASFLSRGPVLLI